MEAACMCVFVCVCTCAAKRGAGGKKLECGELICRLLLDVLDDT